jgi:hypothetical protein
MQRTSWVALIQIKDGAIVLRAACRLGCEGIVSKRARLDLSPGSVAALYRSQKFGSASGEARDEDWGR